MTDGVESRMLRAAMARAMAKTDRKLLEAAAKAFWGDDIDDCCSIQWLEEDQAIGYTHADNQDHNGEDREFVWNPLTDEGDALRLAVALGLAVSVEYQFGSTAVLWGPPIRNIREQHGTDPYAATRRAIVRAAAEIGQGMPRPTPAADLPEDNYYKTQAEAFGYGRAK